MMVIHRYPLSFRVPTPVEMEIGDKMLSVGTKDGREVSLWVLHRKTGSKTAIREFAIFGTGNPIPNDAEFIGSAICEAGALVWHVFEVFP